MRPAIVIHYHEIALKGENRVWFEQKLIENVRWALRAVPEFRVYRMSGRVVVRGCADTLDVRNRLAQVFGIANFGIGCEVGAVYDELERDVVAVVREHLSRSPQTKSFVVRAKRSNKAYPLTSVELERRLGAAIGAATSLTVDLEQADMHVRVEIVERTAFVFIDRAEGPGGLPVGISGKVLALLSSGFDSPVASWRMMRRGCHVDFVHFHSYPYTSDASIRNVEEIARVLAAWEGDATLFFVPIIEYQKVVMTDAPAALRVLLYRRMMYRVAEQIAQQARLLALVTGESLGQVASQTIPNLAAVGAVVSLPVFRPLVGTDKREIIEEAERIGTAPISARPYDDCCSLFTPTHPETNARPGALDAIEHQIGTVRWVEEIVAKVEQTRVMLD